ncbi:MAG: hypothetical protein IKR41_11625 [Bacteroidales bacterium]|nr:hypothetical protein [Bacteroidales bacterium]
MPENPLKIEKQKLCRRLGISDRTLARMLNELYFDDLLPTNYNKFQKYLYKCQLDIIFPAGIEIEKKLKY